MTREALRDRLAVSPDEAAQLLGISRPSVYTLLDVDGGIPSFRIGRSRRVSVDVLREWVRAQTEGPND